MLANSNIAPVSSSANQPHVACNWNEDACGCEPDEHSKACVREQLRIDGARRAGLCAWCDEPTFHFDFCGGWCREQAHRDHLASLGA